MKFKGNILYGYSRVSTEEQIKKGNSIDFQRKLGEKISKLNGFDDYIHFNEGNVSGTTSPFQRSQFSELFDLIEKNEVKYLFVYEWSRLSRDNFYSEWLRRKFLKHNVQIWEGDTDRPKDLTDPHDKLTSSIISLISTYERENLVKRIKSGIQEGYSKGRWSGNYLPYGYRKDKNRFVVPDEIETNIYHKMVDFIFDGKSIRYITNWLNEKNIPIKSSKVVSKGFIKREREGSTERIDVNLMMWRDQVVSSILKSPLRKGVRISNGMEYDFPKIISPRKWEKLQKKIEDNKRFHYKGNKSKHFYLLKGLLFCKEHETLLLGKIKKDERTYYCSRKRKEVRIKGEPPCPLPSPNLDYIEKVVWEVFVDVMSDSHLVKEEYKNKYLSEKTNTSNKEKIGSHITKFKNQLSVIDKKRNKIINLHLEETISKTESEKYLNKLKDQRDHIEEELESMESHFRLIDDKQVWIDWVENFSSEVKMWESNNIEPKEKREKLLKYIDKITVEYKENNYLLDFYLRYPMINDKFEYVDPNDKKKGYRIKDGDEIITIELQQKNTTYQNKSNTCHNDMIGGSFNFTHKTIINESKLRNFGSS